jgi:hypothetical protein
MTLSNRTIVTPHPACQFVDYVNARFDESGTNTWGAFRLDGLTVVVGRETIGERLGEFVEEFGGELQLAVNGGGGEAA